jgi:hypothetical protein
MVPFAEAKIGDPFPIITSICFGRNRESESHASHGKDDVYLLSPQSTRYSH